MTAPGKEAAKDTVQDKTNGRSPPEFTKEQEFAALRATRPSSTLTFIAEACKILQLWPRLIDL